MFRNAAGKTGFILLVHNHVLPIEAMIADLQGRDGFVTCYIDQDICGFGIDYPSNTIFI